MIKNNEHAIEVQNRRYDSGKKGVAKSVRRFVMSQYGRPLVMVPEVRNEAFYRFTGCDGMHQRCRELKPTPKPLCEHWSNCSCGGGAEQCPDPITGRLLCAGDSDD